MSIRLSQGICVLLALTLFTGALFLNADAATLAQAGKAELTGEVRDQAGADVARATVTVTQVGTGDVASSKTGADGVYAITNLAPGLYTVTVSAQGFRRFVREGVRLTTGERIRVDMALSVGGVEEEVKINADASLLRAETGSPLPVLNRLTPRLVMGDSNDSSAKS